MSKYIYGKYDTDTFPDELKNEFHYLCMYLGAYLTYLENTNEYNSFHDYAKANNLTNKTDDKFRWCYINKSQAFIRDVFDVKTTDKTIKISKRQIRKLGYSGFFSVPMFPKNGYLIEDEIFGMVFNDSNLSSVKTHFIDYISHKWKTDDEFVYYLNDEKHKEDCVRKTAIYFCGFQEYVLRKDPELKRIFQGHTTYKIIQSELERRK